MGRLFRYEKAWLGHGYELLLILASLWLLCTHLPTEMDGWTAWLGIALIAVAIVFPITLPSLLVSLELVFTFYIVLTVDLGTALWVNYLGELVGGLLLIGKSRKMVVLLNPACKVLPLFGGYLVYRWVEAQWLTTGSTELLLAVKLFTIGGVFFLVNHLLLHLGLYLRHGHFSLRSFFHAARWDGIVYLAVFPLAYLGYDLTARIGAYALLVIAVPVAVVAYLFRAFNNLQGANRVNTVCMKLSTAKDLQMICQRTFELARQMTDATEGVLLRRQPDGSFAAIDSDGHMLRVEAHALLEQAAGMYEVLTLPDVRAVEPVIPGWTVRSMVLLPLIGKTEVFGLIVLGKAGTHGFRSAHVQQLRFLASQVSIILDRNHMYEALERAAITNRLTGLYNYQHFYEQLDERFCIAQATHQELSLLLFDIDYFKKYNDLYGHIVGDEVLRQVARLAEQLIKEQAKEKGLLLARYGGEEFAALGQLTGADAQVLAERLRLAIEAHQFVYQQHTVKNITVSIGIASLREHGAGSPSELLEKADQALYWGAKEMGRNRVALYSSDYDQRLFVDSLTGLHTVHYLRRKLHSLIEQRNGLPLHFVHLDLRGMRWINERFGFDCGNAVLIDTSFLLKNTMRADDLICRYQDDEFLVVMKNVPQRDLEAVLERMREAFASHVFPGISDAIGVDLRTVSLHHADEEPLIWERIELARETVASQWGP